MLGNKFDTVVVKRSAKPFVQTEEYIPAVDGQSLEELKARVVVLKQAINELHEISQNEIDAITGVLTDQLKDAIGIGAELVERLKAADTEIDKLKKELAEAELQIQSLNDSNQALKRVVKYPSSRALARQKKLVLI
ncbi:MAG: hypothetical protein AB7F64_02240 [Gammaproteobacteria bacterium]